MGINFGNDEEINDYYLPGALIFSEAEDDAPLPHISACQKFYDPVWDADGYGGISCKFDGIISKSYITNG